jgi:transcriptional regulator with XRE-family HTH domain
MSGSEYLIEELRRLRESLSLTQEAFGERIHFSAQHVGAVERGTRPALPDYLNAIDKVYGTNFSKFYRLFVKNELAQVWFRPWLEHEGAATMIRWFEPLLIPGLLQTEEYARAVLTEAGTFGDEAPDAISSRLSRREVLFRDEKPARFIAVIDETVLHRVIGGPDVMREQLEDILKACERPNIQVHIVPSTVGAYAGLNGPFALATVDGRTVGLLDTPLPGKVVEGTDDLAILEGYWESIRGYALPCDQSLDLIMRAAQSWTT